VAPPDRDPSESGRNPPHINGIFNACIQTGHNPTNFQCSTTVVLRKAGFRDLSNHYYHLLSDTHLGRHKGISTDHAIQIMLHRIDTAWGKGMPVVSLLMFDVSGAYDNVSHERSLHKLRKCRLGQLKPWMRIFQSNRSTGVKMPEGLPSVIPTPTGISRDLSLSPILYLIYHADLQQDYEETRPDRRA
ncbi:reverse transcriptase, partial [Penicillium atrosanguineum]